MSTLIESGINLTEVVEKFKSKEVEVTEQELIQIEKDDNLRIIKNTEAYFNWMYNDKAEYEELVRELITKSPKEFEPYDTVFNYIIGVDNRIVELEDGHVIFLFG